ncbi:RNA polymerase sigma factor SigJ [Actinomadura citrea]|jgi:RNA polymerase sigma-70 factor (ECF subfamily)|uniref:RNA polymerase sigma-70 factor (ECF subfamily) n=1 Tax=Actinomadura citrea TaxID=46158 RepID=A0A7Y9G815_9ACTN|nr:RNA polymerase sigma factor SigJ [Actinomadura citrea]NYE11578.1 RNA polymerase sigma-70 factor (ECF subfamily) [Actinomadura citrea]GGT87318.1 RNA polymerase sigma24 factor [Actinomadura citrea]
MSEGTTDDTATRVFADHRELLFSVVYNMIGSVADTEDVLQDTWLAWASRSAAGDPGEIENPRAYLVRIAVNTALSRQAAISRRRETYVGPWLPEPLVARDDVNESTERTEAVSMALLVVLETLTPLERAVFVLHEVFGYAHTEIAPILDRSPAAVRQLAHRAREHVHARRPRYQADPKVQRQATERFLQAALGGDLDALMDILAPDVTLWTDGGGKSKATAALRPIHGADRVARAITGTTARRPMELDIIYRTVNGDPSAVLFNEDAPFAVMVLDLDPDGHRVRGVYAVTNPDKLTHIEEDG